jgi:hypothetical protein
MRTLAALAVLLLVAACQAAPTPEMTAAEHEAIVTAVTDQVNAMTAAWDNQDVNATMAFFHPEKTAMAWSGRVSDYQSLKERWENVWGNYTGQETSWTSQKVEVFSEEAAVFQGQFDLTVTEVEGRVLNYPGNCVWTAVFEPYNGKWLMTYVSYNWGGYNVVEEG